MDCVCGEEAELFYKKGLIGEQVWFRCKKCGNEWQDYCHSCQCPLEVLEPDQTCIVCGGH